MDIVPQLLEELEETDVVLTMGAGNIWQAGEELVKQLQERARRSEA